LTVDGILREQTLAALNVPAPVRLAQLKVNVTRLRALAPIWRRATSSPTFRRAHRGDRERRRCVAPYRRSRQARPAVADINSKIVEINFNPYWTVPASIVKKTDSENAGCAGLSEQQSYPHLQRQAPGTAAGRHQLVLGGCDPLQLSPGPGSFNSLGSIRINFPNAYQVYMHDTPLKNLFGEDFRFHSSAACGCRTCANW